MVASATAAQGDIVHYYDEDGRAYVALCLLGPTDEQRATEVQLVAFVPTVQPAGTVYDENQRGRHMDLDKPQQEHSCTRVGAGGIIFTAQVPAAADAASPQPGEYNMYIKGPLAP